MNPDHHQPSLEDHFLTRRAFLNRFGMGFGALSLATILGPSLFSAQGSNLINPLAPKQPHFPGKAKRVIHIFAQGAPSQVDTWDPKPELTRLDGQDLPGVNGVAMGSPFKFTPRGKSGIEVSEVFPLLGDMADDLCVVRSCYTDIPAHEVATVFMNTGSTRQARPSLGSWVLYGLGTENQNMPGFIALRPGGTPPGGSSNWQSSFLPGVYQGMSVNTQISAVNKLIENIRNDYTPIKEQRRQLDLVHQLNEMHNHNLNKESQLEARIEAYEMAFKMQTEATDAFDITKEPADVRKAYGSSKMGTTMLAARRVDRGSKTARPVRQHVDHLGRRVRTQTYPRPQWR